MQKRISKDIMTPDSLEEVLQALDVPLKNGEQDNDVVLQILSSEELCYKYKNILIDFESITKLCKNHSPEAIGRALFILMHIECSSSQNQNNSPEIQKITRNEIFVSFFCWIYETDDSNIGLTSLEFHKSGTTSFIFRAWTKKFGVCALKVIQAQYLNVKTIRDSTKNYAKLYGVLPDYSVDIYDSESKWIAMDLIRGSNLREYLILAREKFDVKPGLNNKINEQYLSNISDVLISIIRCLRFYHKNGLVHGDISPLNIMIEHDELVPKRTRLIDFGPNYVLKERAGSGRIFAASFSQAELFTAPEVLEGSAFPTVASDIYSLGMIGLETLARDKLEEGMIGSLLEQAWETPEAVGFAQIIEDMIDTNPKQRLALSGGWNQPDPYATLLVAVDAQMTIYRNFIQDKDKTNNSNSLMYEFWRAANIDTSNAVKILNRVNTVTKSHYRNIPSSLINFSKFNLVARYIFMISFLIFTLVDAASYFKFNLSIIPVTNVISDSRIEILNSFGINLNIGDFWGNLPGRLVALTFGLIATSYYANIFATIHIDSKYNYFERFSEIFLRFNSFSYFLPVMVALTVYPKLWPYCAFSGAIFTAFNNLFMHRVGIKAADSITRNISLAKLPIEKVYDSSKFLHRGYQEWFPMMFLYCLGILIVGILMDVGYLKDEIAYAAIVCAINMAKIYRNNCGTDAPAVAGNLARLFYGMTRVRAFQKLGSGESNSSTPGTGSPRAL